MGRRISRRWALNSRFCRAMKMSRLINMSGSLPPSPSRFPALTLPHSSPSPLPQTTGTQWRRCVSLRIVRSRARVRYRFPFNSNNRVLQRQGQQETSKKRSSNVSIHTGKIACGAFVIENLFTLIKTTPNFRSYPEYVSVQFINSFNRSFKSRLCPLYFLVSFKLVSQNIVLLKVVKVCQYEQYPL